MSKNVVTNTNRVINSLRERIQDRVGNKKLLGVGHRIGMLLTAQMTLANRKVLRVRTGALINSIQYRINSRNGGIEIEAGSYGVKYAAIHEFGGIIRARNKPYLKFKIGDQWFSKKQVTIPARPYIRPGFDRAKPRIMEILRGL